MMTGLLPSESKVEGTIPFPHSLEELAQMENELPEYFDMRFDGNMRPVRSELIKIILLLTYRPKPIRTGPRK
jgi:hypothetical protein